MFFASPAAFLGLALPVGGLYYFFSPAGLSDFFPAARIGLLFYAI